MYTHYYELMKPIDDEFWKKICIDTKKVIKYYKKLNINVEANHPSGIMVSNKNKYINFNGIAEVTINETKAQVGGGSLPNEYIDSYAVCLKPLKISVAKLEEDLRKGKYHIISRIQNDMLILDVRTLFEDDFEKISAALKQILL